MHTLEIYVSFMQGVINKILELTFLGVCETKC